MKTMKKMTALLLTLIMLLSLSACGKKDVSGLGTLDMDAPAASDGIGTLGQPSADDTPAEQTPQPEQTTPEPTPVPTEEPAALSLGTYSCEMFSCSAPEGWDVIWNTFDAGGGVMRLMVFISDPEDPNNIIFYVQGLEPFFADTDAKKALTPYLPSEFEWSPVLTDGLNAEGVLRQWGAIYTMLDIQGYQDIVRFKNYSVQNVIQNYVGENSLNTGVLAEVSIPGASTNYAMFLENTLTEESAYSVKYYVARSNLGFVIDPELYNSNLDAFITSKNSFDFSGFLNKYSISADSERTGTFDELPPLPVS